MLSMIIKYLPILGVSVLINIILGMYYNIGISCKSFDWKKLILGIIKAAVISFAFIGIAYCFDMTDTIIDIGTFELNPEFIMTSSIVIYMVKDTLALANILGVKKDENKNINRIEQRDPLDK